MSAANPPSRVHLLGKKNKMDNESLLWQPFVSCLPTNECTHKQRNVRKRVSKKNSKVLKQCVKKETKDLAIITEEY